MWEKRLRIILLSLVLLSWSPCLPFCTSLSAEVILTDEEAEELTKEIQLSEKDLTELQQQLSDVKNTYEEQKKSYEEQLNEAEKENQKLKIATAVTGGSAVSLLIVAILLILL